MVDEEQHPGAESFEWRHRSGEALLGGSEFFNFAAVDGFDEGVAGGEMTVKSAGSDDCLAGDVIEAGGAAVAGEHLFGDFEDALAVAQGISAGFACGRCLRELLFGICSFSKNILKRRVSPVILTMRRVSPF